MIDDNLRYSGTIPDERLHDMRRDLRSPMGGGHGGSGGSGPRGAGVFLVDQVFTRSQDDTYQATKSAFLNPLHKASYGVRIGDIVLFYLNTEGILCTGIVTAISGDTVTFVKHDEISTVGFSPSIATTEITGGHKVTVTNEGGSESFDVMDGVQGPQGEPFEFDDFTQAQLDELRSDVASVYYRKQEATVINFNDVSTIEIPFDNLTFADMLFVDIEGLALTENQDYVINGSTIELTTPITHPNTRINFKLLTIMAITSEDLDTLLEGLADFNGATDSADGTHGLVPAPAAGDDLDVLFGNGEWGALNLTTFSWGNDQSISIQANFDNEQAPAALFGSTSLPLASATKAGLMKLEDYSKLQGIQAGAQANVIESISVNGTAVDVNDKNAAISIPQASSDSAGLMTASDKTKLDTISAFSSDNKAALFADGIWWHLFNEMTPNGHLLLKRGRSTGGATPRPIIETIDDMPMYAASEYTPGLMTISDKAKLNGIEAGANAYTLPAATTAVLGGVKPDGTSVTVDADGTIHSAGGSGGSGYNPALSVGRADTLTGADSTAQWAQRVSTGSGAATVRSVQGAAEVQDGELVPVRIAGITSADAQGGELDAIEWTAQTLRAAGTIRDVLYSDHVDVRVGVVDLGTLTWTKFEDARLDVGYYFYAQVNDMKDGNSQKLPLNRVCAKYPTITDRIGLTSVISGYGAAIDDVMFGASSPQAFVIDSTYTTAADFKAAMSGVYLFYELATPTTTPISPALPMTYRVEQGGTEAIIVPAGEVSAPPVLTIADGKSAAAVVMDALACIAAPDGPIATSNHALGTYLTMGGKLYKVTSAIAVGETITPNTNVTETTVMAELIARTA